MTTGRLTTHALDTARGCGAAGLSVEVRRLSPTLAVLPGATLDEGGQGGPGRRGAGAGGL